MQGRNNSLRAQKMRKLQELKSEGVKPYAYKFARTHKAAEIASAFSYLDRDQHADTQVRVCGRIMRERNSWMFIDLEDDSGKVQLYCHKSNLSEKQYRHLRLLDRGDLVGIVGTAIRTKHGEISIKVESWELMAKSLQVLPEPEALNDPDLRYRNRHLDLILNPEAAQTLRKRSLAVRTIRNYLDERDYLEIETPILNVQASGAEARPFVTHHNSLDIDLHLRIAPEMYLRRLLVGGIEKVYEIGKNFRNEGLSTKHNPEFTSIELFAAYCDIYDLMKLTENLLRHVVQTVCKTGIINYQGVEIDFGKDFESYTMTGAIKKVCGVELDGIKELDEMKAIALSIGVRLSDESSCGEIINTIFEQKVEQTLIQPTFITDYPVEVSVCQQLHREREGYVERFELFVYGRELANACSELNDPLEQKRRFEMQAKRKDLGHEEIPEPDLEFVRAMEYGMPPMMGLGIGIDRLVMFLTDSASIKDVIAFPTMKPLPKVSEMRKRSKEEAV